MLPVLDIRTDPEALASSLDRERATDDGVLATVRDIIATVRRDGDAALRHFTQAFDRVTLASLVVPPDEIDEAWRAQPIAVQAALTDAAARIRRYHDEQRPTPRVFETEGIRIRDRAIPVARAGLYVPGGRAAYPSTVLMTAIPAAVAGVGERVLCVPPGPDGAVPAITLAAAHLTGVERVVRVGGAQAIAAMAYGTGSVPACDVIVGPGNQFVALAKREVAGVVHVESMAGPSEVAIVADATADPRAVALDLCAQAEHGPGGTAVVITWDRAVADAIQVQLAAEVPNATRADEIRATLATGGAIALVEDAAQARVAVDALAPEHLQVMCADALAFAEEIRNAGAIFVGNDTPAALGDYAVGTNHVLPTGRAARYASALRVDDFLKHTHIVDVDREGLYVLAPTVMALAEVEGLDAHAAAVRVRLREEGS